MCDYTIHKLQQVLNETANIHLSITEKKDILKAVEKGIKRELLFKRKIGKYHSLFVCPNCKKNIFTTGAENDYPLRCSHCGQRLSWKEFKRTQECERKALAKMLMESEVKSDVSAE